MRNRVRFVLVAMGLGLAWANGSAQDSPPGEPWHKAITFNAFLEASYTCNFNHPDSGLNSLRVFDFDDRKPKLDLVELVVQRPVSEPAEFGFRLDATAGQSVPEVTASYGLFRDRETGEARDYDIHQVFASWVAPLGKGLKLDAGKFITPFGYEVIDGYDGYNDNQTRSLLFGYAIPFTHTGVRASYPFTDRLAGSAMVVQGWDNWQDNNGAKSVIVQLALAPSGKWSLYLNAMGGPEQTDDDRDERYLVNVVSACKPRDNLTLGLDMVYGTEEGAPSAGQRASWSGLGGIVRYGLTSAIAIVLRAETFDDTDGTRTGTPQTLREVTLTPEFKIGKHFVLRGDLRCDWSDREVFQEGADSSQRQPTAAVALLCAY